MPDVLLNRLTKLKNSYEETTNKEIKCDWFVFGLEEPYSENLIERWKQKFCKLAGVKEIRIHDFRHSHASLLLSQNPNILLVAKRLGHSDVKETHIVT